jgi:hypothetical protein
VVSDFPQHDVRFLELLVLGLRLRPGRVHNLGQQRLQQNVDGRLDRREKLGNRLGSRPAADQQCQPNAPQPSVVRHGSIMMVATVKHP